MLLQLHGISPNFTTDTSKERWSVVQNKPLHPMEIKEDICLLIHDEHISLQNKFESGIEAYVSLSNTTIKISLNILDVLDADTEICLNVVIGYLNGIRNIGDSLWKGVHIVGPGVIAELDRKQQLNLLQMDIEKTYGDPASILTSVIAERVKDQQVAVRFSGGLESTSLLAACSSIISPEDTLALTWFSKNDGGSSDITESTRIARKLNINHIMVPIDEKSLFCIEPSQRLPAYPTPALAFSSFLKELDSLAINHFSGNTPVILDGHGGDHIFLEYVDPPMLRDCMGSGFFGKLREYCNLNAAGYFQVIPAIALGEKSPPSNILSKQYRKSLRIKNILTSVESLRKNRVREALDEISLPRSHQESKLFYPFLHPLMIGRSLSLNVSELFNSQFSRAAFRNSAYKKFGSDLFSRDSKGVVTGSFQKSLQLQRDYLIPLVMNGFCASRKIINLDIFKKIYDQSSQGVGGVNYELMKIIMIEILIHHTYQALKERKCN